MQDDSAPLGPEERLPWRVTDLKQWAYCPRILYYHTCLPRVRPTTYKMEASVEAHGTAEELEERRSLRAYGLRAGQRQFNVWLESERLGMRGQVDLVIETETEGRREAIPVDYKLAERAGEHFVLQLTAYAAMLEETWGVEVRRGFFYFIPLRRAQEVRITAARREALDAALREMNAMLLSERMPAATGQRARCVACEFRRFCNDVL